MRECSLILKINFFFSLVFFFLAVFLRQRLQIRKKSTRNALKTCFQGRVLLFSIASPNLHNKSLHSKSMTYSSVIGSRRSNTYSILISKFCSFAPVRLGGEMFCDVVLWVELVKDFYVVVWLTAKGNKTYLFFSKTGELNISRIFTQCFVKRAEEAKKR